jgi:hypothetical protein
MAGRVRRRAEDVIAERLAAADGERQNRHAERETNNRAKTTT